MEYHTCLNYLENLGNEYLTMKMGLDEIRTLLSALDNPHHSFRSVLVAGTNGKGSVSRFIESVFRSDDPNCGLYTSPHLLSLRERIAIGGNPIQRPLFARAFTKVTRAVRECRFKYHPTYFEMLTATAFVAFQTAGCNRAVIEVGLGGRLDATNVLSPEASVITPIGFDHQRVLGHSLDEIAREKAGIMRPQTPVLVAPQSPEARAALLDHARRVEATWIELDPTEIHSICPGSTGFMFEYRGHRIALNVPGKHQMENAALALLTVETLANNLQLQGSDWGSSIGNVQPYGSLRCLDQNPLTLIDGGHNPHAFQALSDFVSEHAPRPRTLVLGMMRDKDVRSSVPLLADHFDQVLFVPVDSPRSATPEDLAMLYSRGQPMEDPLAAVRLGRQTSQFVLVAGSYYLAGEVLNGWKEVTDRNG